MGLDIRLPIGMMFSLLGPILIATGLLSSPTTPVNFETGAAMTLFGAVMLCLGWRSGRGK